MKKLLLVIFLITSFLLLSKETEKKITIKSGSYCTGFLSELGYNIDFPTEEYYMFKKCVINGKTYNGDDYQEGGIGRAALRVYFSSSNQRETTTRRIRKSGTVYLKTGKTMIDEGNGSWGINIRKIAIK